MSFQKKVFLFIFFLAIQQNVMAQEQCSIKFGKVTPSDFNIPQGVVDSSSNAVIIADIGKSSFEGNSNGWFTLVFKRSIRIKILNRNGLDAANFQIPYYIASFVSGGKEKVDNLKGVTYNLENGIVVPTKLEGEQVFTEKNSKNWYSEKFTLPAVKEGSLIEISYTIRSEFLENLRDWEFQGKYPHLWSEYEVQIPEYFKYLFLSQGNQDFHDVSNKMSRDNYQIILNNGVSASERLNLTANVIGQRWVMKNIAGIETEKYITTIKNHVSKIEFQLSQINLPDQGSKDIIGNWGIMNKKLIENENFGLPLTKNNSWLDDDMKKIMGASTDKLERARKAYYYIRNNFSVIPSGNIYLTEPLKTIFTNKKGTQSEINLLLTAWLKHDKIEASPILLSTRSNGKTYEFYPLMDKYNHVISTCTIDGSIYYLDASDPLLGFGKISYDCYNGPAKIIGDNLGTVYLMPDSIKDTRITSVFMAETEAGVLEASVNTTLGYFESMTLRNKIRKASKESVFKQMKLSFNSELALSDLELDSLNEQESPICKRYKLSLVGSDEDLIYLNPIFENDYSENPFAAAERKFPLEMPYLIDEIYVFSLSVPKNYTIDDYPKSIRAALNKDNDAYYEYLVQKNEEQINIRSRVYIKRTNFEADEYQGLRDFFGLVVKKHAEQIVLKKIK